MERFHRDASPPRVALVLATCLVLLLSGRTLAHGSASRAESLQERIEVLRLRADYAAAADVARQLVALRAADSDAAPFEIVDAEILLETMQHVAGLPRAAQRELALADSLADVGELLQDEGKYSEAIDIHERQLDIRRRLLGRNHTEVADTLIWLSEGYRWQGDLSAAESLYREALAARREQLGDEHPDVAVAVNGLGWMLYGVGDYAGAEALYREALAIARRALGDEHRHISIYLDNLAQALARQGDYAAAEPLYNEALAIKLNVCGSDHPLVATTLSNLARLLRATGDYTRAESLYREALSIRRKSLGADHPRVAVSLRALAELLRIRGDYAEAELLHREALDMSRSLLGEVHPNVALSLGDLSLLMHERGDLAAAEPLCRQALAMKRRLHGDSHPEVATSLNNLGGILADKGDYEAAEACYDQALEIRLALFGTPHTYVAQSLNNAAHLAHLQDRIADAESLYVAALSMRRELLGESHPDVAASLMNLAEVAADGADCSRRETILAEAARAYDAARLRAGFGMGRSTFLGSPYPRLAAARLALGRNGEAWPAAEKSLARTLADLLVTAEKRDLTQIESAREDSLEALLCSLEREVATYRQAAAGDSTGDSTRRAEAALDALLEAEALWCAFQEEVAAAHPVTEGQIYTLEHVQSCLPEGRVVIGWLDEEVRRGNYESWCYAIRDSGPVWWRKAGTPQGGPGSGSPFEAVRSFRAGLANPESSPMDLRRQSRDLWRERIEPLLPALRGVTELVVIPSGAMLGVPVESLARHDGVTLGDLFSVSYTPSATIHTWLVERETGVTGRGVLLVGDPPYCASHAAAMESEEGMLLASAEASPDADVLRMAVAGNEQALRGLPRLHGTREEVASVAAVCDDATALLGAEATEQELARLVETGVLGEFMAIHLATHALVDEERPERSALVLSQVDLPDPLEAAMAGTRIYDGLLTAEEILREWEMSADLVTLSACQTGLGREVRGEGFVGFAHAFLQAGARSLVVSLWEADDRATSLLMQRFYENWLGKYDDEQGGKAGEPMSKAEALREAKRHIRTYTNEYGHRPYEHPFYWSAFILIGDPT